VQVLSCPCRLYCCCFQDTEPPHTINSSSQKNRLDNNFPEPSQLGKSPSLPVEYSTIVSNIPNPRTVQSIHPLRGNRRPKSASYPIGQVLVIYCGLLSCWIQPMSHLGTTSGFARMGRIPPRSSIAQELYAVGGCVYLHAAMCSFCWLSRFSCFFVHFHPKLCCIQCHQFYQPRKSHQGMHSQSKRKSVLGNHSKEVDTEKDNSDTPPQPACSLLS
jgi:hypothetical protein